MYNYSETCIKEKKGCDVPNIKTFELKHIAVLKKEEIPKTIWSKDADLNDDGIITQEEFKKWEAKKESIVTIAAVFIIPILILIIIFTMFYVKQKMSG